jgi:hypothetical protein
MSAKTKEINCYEDLIDVRDVIARFEELEETIAAEEISEDNGAQPQLDDDGKTKVVEAQCGECGKTWNDALITERTPAPSARCPYESIHEEIEEFTKLTALLDELRGNGGDERWKGDWYPITLVRDSYFKDFAMQEAEDLDLIPKDAHWPATCIDWDQATRELQMDYTTCEFDGVTYWYR